MTTPWLQAEVMAELHGCEDGMHRRRIAGATRFFDALGLQQAKHNRGRVGSEPPGGLRYALGGGTLERELFCNHLEKGGVVGKEPAGGWRAR